MKDQNSLEGTSPNNNLRELMYEAIYTNTNDGPFDEDRGYWPQITDIKQAANACAQIAIDHAALSTHPTKQLYEAVEGWVSVEERRPEYVGSYLCYTNDGRFVVCWVNQVGWWTVAINNSFSGDMGEPFIRDSKPVEREVTHWMPLPTPPQSPPQPND